MSALEQLWAGWRAAYVTGVTDALRAEDESEGDAAGEAVLETTNDDASCVFCTIIASDAPDVDRGLVHASELAVAILNAYPYTSGHLLVLPRRHVSDLDELSRAERDALWLEAEQSIDAITAAYGPDGINLGANLGRAAGAGIPGHLHLHALPRWLGDTNFMTTIAGVRVMPEALSETFAKLRAGWPSQP